MSRERIGVLLANTGTPTAPTPKAVRSYLAEFLSHPRIVPMNRFAWSVLLHLVILPFRSRASAAKYASVWTEDGSPFLVAHKRLEQGLLRSLRDDSLDAAVACGMSFGEPSIRSALELLRSQGCERIVCLPLFPQSAFSTTRIVEDGLSEALSSLRWDVPCDFVESYGTNGTYVRAVAARIEQAGFRADEGDRLVFSFHSVPLADIECGDTYELQTSATCLAVAERLGLPRSAWTVAYQSRFDKGREWLSPTTKDALSRMAGAGSRRVFVTCPGFAVDCLETLVDVDRELRAYYYEQVKAAGGEGEGRQFAYVPCLGGTKAHVSVVRDVLSPYL